MDERKPIGKTTASKGEPNTSYEFKFWLADEDDVKLNPLDFVTVVNEKGDKTVGIVQEIYHYTDADSHITNYIGSDLGNVSGSIPPHRISTNIAKVSVIKNIPKDIENKRELYMPIPINVPVYYPNTDEISQALGVNNLKGEKIPVGIITQGNGEDIPIFADSAYLIGKESAHVNATGISGLASKTSYLMFLLFALYQKLEKMSAVIFNVKGGDLLHLHEKANDLTQQDLRMYELLEMEPKPFDEDKITYYLPLGDNGRPKSDNSPANYKIYAYELADIYDSLDLLFANYPDQWGTLDLFTNYIKENWKNGLITFKKYIGNNNYKTFNVSNWYELRNLDPKAIGETVYNEVTHRTPNRILRILKKITSDSIFVNNRNNEVYLGEEVKKDIKSGKIMVVDIFKLPLALQALVIGDIMKRINELFSGTSGNDIPPMVIFIDELNTFAPDETNPNPVNEQIIEISRKGRFRKISLFGAQQFKSEVHKQVWGNCTLHVIGKSPAAELRTPAYANLSQSEKQLIDTLLQGEVVLNYKLWRNSVKVRFPRPPYKRVES